MNLCAISASMRLLPCKQMLRNTSVVAQALPSLISVIPVDASGAALPDHEEEASVPGAIRVVPFARVNVRLNIGESWNLL